MLKKLITLLSLSMIGRYDKWLLGGVSVVQYRSGAMVIICRA